jgi:hypothetical protein
LSKQKPKKPEQLDMNDFSYKDRNEYALMAHDESKQAEEKKYEEKITKLKKEQENFKDDETIVAAFEEDIAKLEKEMEEKSKSGKAKLEKNIEVITSGNTYKKFTEVATSADQNIAKLATTRERLEKEFEEENIRREEEKRLNKLQEEQFPIMKKYIEIMKNPQEPVSIKEIFDHPDTINPWKAVTYLQRVENSIKEFKSTLG